MTDSCWIPDFEFFEDYHNDWPTYENVLYQIFSEDFLQSQPYFERKRVAAKKYPIQFEKEDAFFHLTCKDYDGNCERVPDFRRCERIRWMRAFIENYNCDPTLCENCEGVKVWREPYKSRSRVNILLEEERYIVVLEDREKYFLLITAFYLDYANALEKRLKHYEQYKEN